MHSVATAVREEEEHYKHGEEWPLRSYAAVMGAYGTAVAALAAAAALTGRKPDRPGVFDTMLMAGGTYKLARIIAKDPVTSPLRAPFTRYAGTTGPSELAEEVRGHGIRHAVGELVTCPFCMSQWSALAFAGGLIFAAPGHEARRRDFDGGGRR
jgi:hypothetical protein